MLGFAYKRFDARVPEPGELDDTDTALLAKVEAGFGRVGELIALCKFKAALAEAMALAHEANRYLNEKEPWKQIKTDRPAAATSIYVALQVIDWLKTIFCPFLPFSSQRLHEYLGYDGSIIGRLYIETVQEETRSHQVLRYDGSGTVGRWAAEKLEPGQPLRKAAPLYKKLDESIVDEEVARMVGGSE